MPRPLDADKRAAILADITAGTLSRNAIARKHGVGAGTVTKLAQDNNQPTAFDRSKTIRATRAHEADARSEAVRLAGRQLARAHRIHDRLDADVYEWQTVTATGITITVRGPWPPSRDERELAAASAAYGASATKLRPATDDSEARRSVVADMARQLWGSDGEPVDEAAPVDP